MKYAFYLSKNGTRYIKALQRNILSQNNTAFALVDSFDTPKLRQICKDKMIPLYQYSYEKEGLQGKERNDFISNIFLELLNRYACSHAFILGGRLLLQGRILVEYDKKIINFHPSILPSYKGEFKAIDTALKDNVMLLGNTAHFVNVEADGGIMIMQSMIAAREFAGYDSVLDLQLPMLKQIIGWLEQERFFFDDNGKFFIRDAKYDIGQFVPNLEMK